MINWFKNLRLDMRVIGLLFMIWGFTILLEAISGITQVINEDYNQSLFLLTRSIWPLIIGFYLYTKGDDILMRLFENEILSSKKVRNIRLRKQRKEERIEDYKDRIKNKGDE